MATRLYPNNTAASTTPTNRGAWDSTASVIYRNLGFHKAGSSQATYLETSATNAWDVLMMTLVTEPLEAYSFTASDTIEWLFAVRETDLAMNAFYHVHAYVMTPSNTVRGTLLSDNIGATEFPTTSTGRTEGAKTLSAVSMQKGDRIVVEIGYRANNTVTTSYGVVIDRFATGADLTSGSTDVTLSPWVQFSANIMPVVSAGFYDNFPSSLDTAKWNDLSSNGGSAVVSGGQLVLNSGVADGEGIISSDHPYSLIGSSLSTYVSADVSVGTTVNHIFALRSYPTTSVAGQYIAWEITRSGSTRTLAAVSYNVAGTKTTHYSTTSIGTTYTGYLRIRESGGTIFWDSSPDNMTWTALASTASSGLAIRPEGMYPSLRTQSPSNITSYWDSINYSSSIENISDNFDDNSIDVAKWTAFNSPSEASNKLDITTTLGGIYRGLTSKLYYDLTSASVNVEVVSAGNQSLVSLEVYPLNLYQSGNTNSIFFLIAGGALIAYRRVNGVSTQLATTTYNSTNHRWLQIRESGGTTYWETSANGTSWSTLHSATNPIHVGQLLVEISAGTYAAEATTTTVTFDNLNVLPVTLTKTQPATAQIANDVTKTQPAIGHVATNPTKTQPAAAVIAGSGELTQTASAWIVETGDIQKTHLYKMFAGGQYLGLLPNVTSEFGFSQDMNTLGTQIAVEVGVSADTSNLAATDTLLEEDGDVLQTEDDEDLTTEGAVNLVGVGVSTETLIRNANRLEVWEYSKYHPNGKRMFIGTVERWEAEFGTGKEGIRLYAYSEGQDMNNYLVTGSPYVNDVSQTTQTANTVIQNNIGGTGTYSQFGQTWEVGASVTNLGAIDLMLDGQADVTVKVYSSVPTNPTSGTPIGVTTVAVDTTGPEVVQMAFSTPITTTPGATYFFAASVASGQSIKIHYEDTNIYADGSMYVSSFGGGGGSTNWIITPIGAIPDSDLYFRTYRNAGETTAIFASQDPTVDMAVTILDTYNAQGGRITYSLTSIDATGLSVPYTFNTQRVSDGMRTILDLAPSDFYYYVDVGDSEFFFKERSTTPDIYVTKGAEINSLRVVATIENLSNSLYFSGGDDGSGFNLYKTYDDPTSISFYGRRVGIKSDGRVTLDATADAIGNSYIDENKDEQFQTILELVDGMMDITLLKPGMTVGFQGFGSFVDSLVLQIVRLEYRPQKATLLLGALPPQINKSIEQTVRDVQNLQTIANPASPS